jgi:hypothetical protein
VESEDTLHVESADEHKRQKRLIRRHAQESWIYPIISLVLGVFGLPIALLKLIALPLGLYGLIRSYINIKNGDGKGIIGHVVAGTVLNLLIIASNSIVLYALYFSR